MDANVPVRLQKLLAIAGVASRRHAEALIQSGRVAVNGVPAHLGQRADPARERVTLDGQPLDLPATPRHAYLLYKPRGLVCTRAAGEGKKVFDLFPDAGPTLLTAGRLDKDSEGALLLSNHGDWIHRWTHPSFKHAKVYQVTVSGPLRGETFKRLNDPIIIDEHVTRPAQVRFLRSANRPGRMILEIVLHEGRNRQIRRMCEQVELTVHRLIRTRIGPLTLAGLKPGQWRALRPAEILALNTEAAPEPGELTPFF